MNEIKLGHVLPLLAIFLVIVLVGTNCSVPDRPSSSEKQFNYINQKENGYWVVGSEKYTKKFTFKGIKIKLSQATAFRTEEDNWLVYTEDQRCSTTPERCRCALVISGKNAKVERVQWDAIWCPREEEVLAELREKDPIYKQLHDENYVSYTVVK